MTTTPDDTVLRQFLLGTLPPAEAAAVEAWLERHPDASVRLRSLSAHDTVTDAINADANTSVGGAAVPTLPGGLPAVVGGYRVVRALGRGGMGAVLEAEDAHLKRRVAIKLIAAEFAASAQARDRFLREAQAVARIDHPNVVPVHHVGEHDGQLYLVMPLLKGETLDSRLKREKKLKAAEVMRIGREVAAGLAAAHAVGLIHRDIKPANIWLDADTGRARVLDFGLAKPLDQSADGDPLTSAGAVIGTLHYMSPQQANGESLDERTDLFSLGCVLHHAATGVRPFDGPTKFAVLYAVVNDTPSNLEALREALPARVADVVRELLEKRPDARPKSAAEVVARLADAPAVVAVPAAAPRGTRRRTGVLLAGVLAALVAGVVLTGQPGRNNGGVAKMPPPVPPVLPDSQTPPMPDPRPSGQPNRPEPQPVLPPRPGAYPLALAEAPAGANGLLGAAVVPVVGRGEPRAVAFHPKGEELAVLSADNVVRFHDPVTLAFRRAFVCPSVPGEVPVPVTAIAWSPDGKRLAAADRNAAVRVWEAATGKVVWEANPGSRYKVASRDWHSVSLRWSPDGKWLAANENLLDAATGRRKLTLNGPDVLWSPNSKHLICRSCERIDFGGFVPAPAKRWDAEAGKELGDVGPLPALLGVSDDGNTVLACHFMNGVSVHDLAKGTSRPCPTRLNASGFQELRPHYSADGSQVWVAGTHGVAVLELATGKEVYAHPVGVGNAGGRPGDLCPVTGRAAVGHSDGTIDVWSGVAGRFKSEARVDRPRPVELQLSPDGRTLLSLERAHNLTVGTLLDARTGEVRRVLFNDLPGGAAAGWRPDGQVVAVHFENGKVRLKGWKTNGSATDGATFGGVAWSAGHSNLYLSADGKRVSVVGGRLVPEKGTAPAVAAYTVGRAEPDWVDDRTARSGVWSPNGTKLATIGAVGAVLTHTVLDGATGKEAFAPIPSGAVCVAWASDGAHLLALIHDQDASRLAFIDPATGKAGRAIRIASDLRYVPAPACHPTGGAVAVVDPDEGTVRVYAAGSDDGRLIHTFPRDGYGATPASAQWSADGKSILFRHGGTAVLLDPTTGGRFGTLAAVGTSGATLVSPDGHVRGASEGLRYVVITKDGQETLTASEFEKRFNRKNDESRARLAGE